MATRKDDRARKRPPPLEKPPEPTWEPPWHADGPVPIKTVLEGILAKSKGLPPPEPRRPPGESRHGVAGVPIDPSVRADVERRERAARER